MTGSLRDLRARIRAEDYDRYLCAQFAPPRARPGLLAVTGFACEVAKIPARVKEPTMGRLRVAWWRDALDRLEVGDPPRHPAVAALAAIGDRRRAWPLLAAVLDACDRGFETDDTAVPAADIAAATQCAWLAVLGVDDARAHAAAALAGRAWAIANAPDNSIGTAEESRRCLRDARSRAPPRAALPALLPGAIAGAVLARRERGRPSGRLPRQAAVLRAALRGRL